MAQDTVRSIDPADGWIEATDAEVVSLDIFDVKGPNALLVRWQDAAPLSTDARHGITWPPGQPAKDFTVPGGQATRMWVLAAFGRSSFYIKHA